MAKATSSLFFPYISLAPKIIPGYTACMQTIGAQINEQVSRGHFAVRDRSCASLLLLGLISGCRVL